MRESEDRLRYHGGRIDVARRLFPNAPEPWIDLSTGINPVAYPIGQIPPSAWTRLPEPSDLAALEAAAGLAYGARPGTEIVAAPGTQALIQWLPRIFPAARAGILGFTYGEHETCWRAAGAQVSTVETLAGLTDFDAAVIVNPNNPDGRTFAPERLLELARAMNARGGWLAIDEAFMDVLGPRSSAVPLDLPSNTIVLRSVGKIYGLAGLRLGFAAAAPEIARKLRAAIGPWPVSGPAIEIGRRALMDDDWLGQTVARLAGEADRLDRMLTSAGFEIAGGTPLFRLARHESAGMWFEHFSRAGILTRPFQAKPDWLRFGIPHTPPEWERVDAVLRAGDG